MVQNNAGNQQRREGKIVIEVQKTYHHYVPVKVNQNGKKVFSPTAWKWYRTKQSDSVRPAELVPFRVLAKLSFLEGRPIELEEIQELIRADETAPNEGKSVCAECKKEVIARRIPLINNKGDIVGYSYGFVIHIYKNSGGRYAAPVIGCGSSYKRGTHAEKLRHRPDYARLLPLLSFYEAITKAEELNKKFEGEK